MTTERIDIEITDKINTNVETKIIGIGKASGIAHERVKLLKAELNMLSSNAITKLNAALKSTTSSLQREASVLLKNERAAMQNAITEQKLSIEKNRAALASQKLIAQTHRSTAAKHGESAASNRAALSALRLRAAQDRLTASTVAGTAAGSKFLTHLRSFGAFVGAGFSLHAILSAVDAYTLLQNKLSNITKGTGELNKVTEELFDIANRTRTDIGATAQAYQRFDIALEQLGASQKESLRLTETVNKSLAVSGATTAEQRTALLQLSQAFNKGKLDGDEFRTVMELMPTAQRAIAKEMGVLKGELFELAPKGKITAEIMRRAFANAADEIDEKFKNIQPTVGQAFTVMKNNLIKFFGELNKSTAMTRIFASALLKLSNNLPVLGAAVVGLSTALVTILLPSLETATLAVRGFTAALAANPFGLIAVGITTTLALLYGFRDEIKVTKDGVVSLADWTKAAFQIAGETIQSVATAIKKAWGDAYGFITKKFDFLPKVFSSIFDFIVNALKYRINSIIGLFVFAFNVVTKTWKLVPGTLKDGFTVAFNFGIDAVQGFANAFRGSVAFLGNQLQRLIKWAIDSFNKLNSLLPENLRFGNIEPANFKLIEFEEIDLSKYKGELSGAGAEMGSILATEAERAFNTDFIGKGLKKIEERARKLAEERESAKLRGEGPPPSDRKKLKSLNIDALQASWRKFHKDQVAAAKKAFELWDAPLKALREVNGELDSELKLLKFVGSELEFQKRFEQIRIQLLSKGVDLESKKYANSKDIIQRKIRFLQKEGLIQEQVNSIYNDTVGRTLELADALQATARAYKDNYINAEQYQRKLIELNLEGAKLRAEAGKANAFDIMSLSLKSFTENYEGALIGLTGEFDTFLKALSDGFADSIGQAIVYGDDLYESLEKVAKGALKELISGIIKLGVQMLINEAQSKAAAISAQTTAATTAATISAEMAAPATLTTLATGGANIIPAIAGIGAVATLVAGIASVASRSRGFKNGGYTGTVGESQIAGFVHGQEFVVNADATARNRQLLEAMNRGINVTSTSDSAQLNITVENYGSSNIEVERVDAHNVRIIARDAAIAAVRDQAPGVIAADIGNPNGRVSRALVAHTSTERKRQ